LERPALRPPPMRGLQRVIRVGWTVFLARRLSH
jgi:hypothetical protein